MSGTKSITTSGRNMPRRAPWRGVGRNLALVLMAGGMLSGAAHAGVGGVQVSLRWQPNLIAFSGPDVYIMFQSVSATGFADDFHPGNRVRITSGTGTFVGTWEPFGGGSSSGGWSTLSELNNAIVSEGVWSMVITDGLSGDVSEYAFTVSSGGLDADYFRSMTLDVAPGSTISSTPTFTISQAPAPTPASTNTSADAGIFATNPSNSIYDGSISPTASTWSPATPLNDDLYLVAITRTIDVAPLSFVVGSAPTLASGPDQLASLTQTVQVFASVQANNLLVGLGPPEAGFNFTDFSSVSELSFVGTAAQNGTEIRLETADEFDGSAGAVWHNDKHLVRDGFRSELSFRVSTIDGSGDGMALVIHDDGNGTATIGGSGSGLGYDGIDRAVAFEYDTFSFSDVEFPEHHLSVQTFNGDSVFADDSSSAAAAWQFSQLSDGAAHTLRVTNIDSRAFMFIDGSSVPELHAPLDMSNVGGQDITDSNGKAYVGLTAANGAVRADWDVLSWSFTPGTTGCNSPAITSAPSGRRVYRGQVFDLSASSSPTGAQPLEVRWFRNGAGLSDSGSYGGTNSDNLEISVNDGLGIAGTYTYGAFDVGGCGASVSQDAVIVVACNPADVANTDGDPFPDNAVDNGDFGLFFSAFFADPSDPLHLNADIANTDGETELEAGGPDGAVDNGDFSAFFSYFFQGC